MRQVVLILVLVFLVAPAWGATYTVRPDGRGDYSTIQAAVDAAVDGDVVLLKNGTFRGDGNRDINTLGKAITICSQSENPKNCVIDCEGTPEDPHRGIRIDSGEGPDTVIEGITITGGFAPMALSVPAGGAMFITGNFDPEIFWTSPTVRNCRFIDNDAPFAVGGVDCFFSNATIENCYFENNRALGYGAGAMVVAGLANVTISDCTFIDNYALLGGGAIGGGFFVGDNSVATITDCYFEDNHAERGGGLANRFETTFIAERCTFVANDALVGGGAAAVWEDGLQVFNECTFVSNSAPAGGAIAAIYDEGPGHVEVNNCTFYGNHSAEGSCFMAEDECTYVVENSIVAFGEGSAAYSGPDFATFMCTDIYGNEGGDWTGAIADQLGVDGNISLDPHLVNPDHGMFYLKDKSPCAPYSMPNTECDLIGAWPVGNGDESDGDGYWAEQDVPSIDHSLLPSMVTARGTQVRYALTHSAQVSIVIYDINGRLTRRLVDKTDAAGEHGVVWDGKNDAGRSVAAGVYFSQLRVNGDAIDSGKIVMIR